MWVSHAAQDKIHMSSHHVLAFDVLLDARRSACRSLMPQLRNPYPALTLISLNPAVVSLVSHENNFFPGGLLLHVHDGGHAVAGFKGSRTECLQLNDPTLPLETSRSTCVTVRFSAPDTIAVTMSPLPSGTRRWIVNPLNVDTALHIHESVQFAPAHVFNTWAEPKLSSSEMEIRCAPIVLDKTHKRSDLLCTVTATKRVFTSPCRSHFSVQSLCTRSPILD